MADKPPPNAQQGATSDPAKRPHHTTKAQPRTAKTKLRISPQPAILDGLKQLPEQTSPSYLAPANNTQQKDFITAKSYLMQYRGNHSTFNAYRRELERLMQWSWHVRDSSITSLERADLETYIEFCMHPPLSWIGTKRVARFRDQQGQRTANDAWRLFVVSATKAAHRMGKEAQAAQYQVSQQALSATFIALGSFYSYLHSEHKVPANPVALIRQKSKYLQRQQGQRKVRRLNELQWDFVVETAQLMAAEQPAVHERSLFIISILYLLYLRISELVSTERWQPKMGDFYCDSQGSWWFHTVSKGNKARDISVSSSMLKALVRYRKFLGLHPELPISSDSTPLVSRLGSNQAITSARQIRNLVQACFNRAITRLQLDGFEDEASNLEYATVHWLRHTGISDDINRHQRPIAHVRDDAGHSSSATTDRYNDIALQERHRSAQAKQIRPDDTN